MIIKMKEIYKKRGRIFNNQVLNSNQYRTTIDNLSIISYGYEHGERGNYD